MNLEDLTVAECIQMLENENSHVIIHAGKITDIVKSCDSNVQETKHINYITGT